MGEGEEMARGPWLCSRRATTKDPGGRRLCFLKRKPISLLGGEAAAPFASRGRMAVALEWELVGLGCLGFFVLPSNFSTRLPPLFVCVEGYYL